MRNLLIAFAIGSLLAGCASPRAQTSPPDTHASEIGNTDPVLGGRIAGGAVFRDQLWLRGGSGGLVSLDLSNGTRRVVYDQGVVDLVRARGTLWVLRSLFPLADQNPRQVGVRSARGEFVVSTWMDGKFDELPSLVLADGDRPLALVVGERGIAVLSQRSINSLSDNRADWAAVELKGQLRLGVQTAVGWPSNGTEVYVGTNRGEWGGGLQRVNLKTGAVADAEYRDSSDLCAGPLNSDCDPVTGVIPDLRNPGCVLASVGLMHLVSSQGRVLKVCENQAVEEFQRPFTTTFNGGSIAQTEAFYGLAPAAPDGFWAVSATALYRVQNSRTTEYKLPKLELVAGVYLSRELPGAIIVRTDINWAVSTSGYTPLLIPLD